MNALSVTNQLARNRSQRTVGTRRQSVAHCKPVMKPRQQLGQQPACYSTSTEAAASHSKLQELHTCISQDTMPAGFQSSDAATCYRVYMTVPPTDVDSYGVVKNTVYHEYLYAARVACGTSLGFPLEVLLEQYGVMTATISVTTHFKSPLQLGDVFFAESVPIHVKGATVKFKERVVRLSSSGKEQQVVAEGEATCVALLPGCPPVKPARIPAPFRQALLRCIDAAASAEAVAHN